MDRFAWYRHKFVNSREMKNDPLTLDRQNLRLYKMYVKSVYNSVEKFERTLNKLNPLHDELSRKTNEFFNTTKKEDQIGRTRNIGDSLLTISVCYKECRGDFVEVVNRLLQITETIKQMEKRIRDRDFAYWEKVHYESKIEKMKSNEKLNGSEKMSSNESKFESSRKRFEEIDSKVVVDLKGLNEERFDEMENLLKMYLVHLNNYYTGIYKKMNEVASREISVVEKFKLTPLSMRIGDVVTAQQSRIVSVASTNPSGVVTNEANRMMGKVDEKIEAKNTIVF